MMIKAGSLTELLDKLSKLAEEETRPSPEQCPECPELESGTVKDPLDTLIRAKIASLVVEHCHWDDTADLKETLETVYDFVTA